MSAINEAIENDFFWVKVLMNYSNKLVNSSLLQFLKHDFALSIEM